MVTKLLIYKILQLFVTMVLGFAIAKFKVVKSEDTTVLSKISLYLLMPAAIINAFDFEHSDGMMKALLFAFLAAIVVHIILLLLDLVYARVVNKSPVERASVMYSNAANLIIPIVSYVLGEEWVVFSIAFLTVQLAFIWSHGVRLFSSSEQFKIKKVLLNVNIIAIVIGLVMMLAKLRLPVFVKEITSSFGGMLGPVAMLIAGMLAAKINFKKMLSNKNIYRVVAIRVAVYPVIIFGVLKLMSFVPILDAKKILLVSFLASITPTASTVMQFAQIHDQDAEYATAINIITTVCCILTMPLFVMLSELLV